MEASSRPELPLSLEYWKEKVVNHIRVLKASPGGDTPFYWPNENPLPNFPTVARRAILPSYIIKG